MGDRQQLWQRFGGHLILVLVAVLLFFGARAVSVSEVLDFGIDETAETLAVDQNGPEPTPIELQSNISPVVGEPESPRAVNLDDVPILVNNSISPELNPITFEGKKPEHTLITYTVQANDTPIGIAEKFGIQPETLLGGNPFLSEESSLLQTGVVLTILPIDGLLHDVIDGDTLESLAQRYGVPADDIVAYEPNKLEFPFRLYPESQILIPGAVREVFLWSAPPLPQRPSTSDSTGSGITPLVQGTGTFIWPVTYRRITQVYWAAHQAIDIGVPEGSPVIASDTGTVTWAGWNVYGYGNLVVINHGNGYETYYAHLNGINVGVGQVVYQGNMIATSGNTGQSSGPHLHFEIRYLNSLLQPLSYLR